MSYNPLRRLELPLLNSMSWVLARVQQYTVEWRLAILRRKKRLSFCKSTPKAPSSARKSPKFRNESATSSRREPPPLSLQVPQHSLLPRSLNDFFPNWTVGAGLSVPIFSGGRLKGEVLAAEAAYDESRLRLSQARDAASLEARLQVEQLEASQSAWLASVGTAAVAQRAYEIAEVRFREGLSTQVELSETRVQWQQALANRAQAARDLQVARVRLALLRALPIGTTLNAGASNAAPAAAPAGPTTRSAGAPAGGPTQPGTPGGGTE
jgi:outer membrane protein TolC